jgi:zinc transport system ATP-binding protein
MSHATPSTTGNEESIGYDEPVVSFRDVSFSYNGEPVLRDATFDVKPRSFVSIIGPNGGGKTTLAKLILGLLTPIAGRVTVLGRAPRQARRRIGYVPQFTTYDPRFPATVMDVALMGRLGRPLGFYNRTDKERAEAALEEVGLGELRHRPFPELSGGQRQRVLIARALAGEPEVLILDEPTANVDIALESRLSTLLRHLNERLTILFITHDLGFVSEDVHHVVCVNREVRFHPTDQVTPEMIAELYGGSVRMVRHDIEHAERGNGDVRRSRTT